MSERHDKSEKLRLKKSRVICGGDSMRRLRRTKVKTSPRSLFRTLLLLAQLIYSPCRLHKSLEAPTMNHGLRRGTQHLTRQCCKHLFTQPQPRRYASDIVKKEWSTPLAKILADAIRVYPVPLIFYKKGTLF